MACTTLFGLGPQIVLFPSAGGSSDQIPLPSPYTTDWMEERAGGDTRTA
jgi:hypothetical protein